MSEDGPELNVKVNVDGATEAADQIKDLGSAGKEAGEKTGGGFKEGAKGLRELLLNSRHSKEIFEALEHGTKGGVAGIMGMIRALRAFMILTVEAVGGPFAAFAVAIGAIIAAFTVFGHRAKEAGEGLKETGNKGDEAKQKIEELDKVSKAALETMLEQLKEVVTGWDELLARIDQAAAANKELRSAQRGLEDAQLKQAKEKELLGASSEEERRAIENKYQTQEAETQALRKKRDAENRIEEAQLKEIAASQTRGQLTGTLDQFRDADADKQSAAKDALRDLNQAAVDRDKARDEAERLQEIATAHASASPTAENAGEIQAASLAAAKADKSGKEYTDRLATFQAAQDAAKRSAENLAKAEEKAAGDLSKLDTVISKAETDIKAGGIEEQTAQAEEGTAALEGKLREKEATEAAKAKTDALLLSGQQATDREAAKKAAEAAKLAAKAQPAPAEKDPFEGFTVGSETIAAHAHATKELKKAVQENGQSTLDSLRAATDTLKEQKKAMDRHKAQIENIRSYQN